MARRMLQLPPGDIAVSLRIEKGSAGLLLGVVDHLSRVADPDQPRQPERTTSHVLIPHSVRLVKRAVHLRTRRTAFDPNRLSSNPKGRLDRWRVCRPTMPPTRDKPFVSGPERPTLRASYAESSDGGIRKRGAYPLLDFDFRRIHWQLSAHPQWRCDEPTDRSSQCGPLHSVETDGAGEIQQAGDDHGGEGDQGDYFRGHIHWKSSSLM